MEKKELQEYLWEDYTKMIGNRRVYHIIFILVTQHGSWLRWKYVKNMRKAAFYQERFQKGNKFSGIPMMWYLRRKNIIGNKLGFEIGGVRRPSEKGFRSTTMWLLYTENRKLGITVRSTVITASVMMA